jgi:anti-anti-sigma factor
VTVLEITVQTDGLDTRLLLAGELDLASRGVLVDCLSGLGTRGGVVLDMSRLTFIDSSALNVIVHEHQRLAGELRELVIENPTPNVRRVFELTELLHLIKLPEGR